MNSEFNEFDLLKLREEIDRIDKSLVSLLAERMEVVKKIGEIKKENNLPVNDPKREEKVIEKVRTLAGDKYPGEIEEIYRNLFIVAKKLEDKV